MNKKFLSVILFSTLMVGTAGTFTSCKDYDDDIEQINNELSGIKSQIEALEGKIKDGKWITSVTPTANGLTITLSDGQTYEITNGKNGQDGAAGAAGTEWTISEDGYWVCNGEKTDVKAVGQDGEKGEPGQQEVKFENGKWFLWNGTEFVEFKGAATTENVPYYYTDPNDQNYTILVVFDKDGQNKKEIRLPMNEGLAQITLLDASYAAAGATIKVGYGLRQSATTWDGDKALPAEGEYLVAVNTNSILVQVTPANYDLATLDLKFVNGKGEEVPVTVGKAAPATLTRAVSATGVYKIDVTVNPIKENEELIKFYESAQPISLMANESVRSTYSSTLSIERPTASTFGNFFKTTVSAESGKDVTVESVDVNKVCFIYDSYLTVEGSEANKALALQNGIEIDGMTVKSNENARGTVKFVAHYVDVLGKVYEQKGISIAFAPEQVETEVIDYAAFEHTVAFADTPSSLVNLDEYFKGMSENERILWNATYKLELEGNVEFSYVDENNNEQSGSLANFITLFNNEGTSLDDADQLKKLKNLKFEFDYSQAFYSTTSAGNSVRQDLFNYDVNYVATVAVKTNEANATTVQLIKVPFTINRPSAEAIATQYTFNANAYDAAKNALVVKGDKATLSNLITLANGAKASQVDVTTAVQPTTSSEYSVTAGVVTKATSGKYNKAYPVTGMNIVYAAHNFAIPTVNVIFQETAQNSYTFGLSKALTINFGGNTVAVKMGDLGKDDTEDAGLNLYDAVGNKLKDVTITKVTLENTTLVTLKPAASGIASGFTLKANSNPEVDTVVTAEVEFTLSDGTAQKTKANVLVTVKAI